ncbi:MAG: hypothetical protein L0Y56_01835 [Nitrospira sp.]|nr:hypothetical protein [Nitrospira sp.]
MQQGFVVLVQYQIRLGKVGEQEVAVRDWVKSIQALNDPEIRYSVYKAEDGVSFVHYVCLPTKQRAHG